MILALILAAFDFSPALIDEGRVEDFLHQLPSAYTLEFLLEANATGMVFGYEDAQGMTRIDPQKVSVFGDSYTWSRWRWNGIDISDPLFAGASAFRLPFRMLDSLSVPTFESGVDMHTSMRDGLLVGGLGVTPGFGGRGPLAVEIADKWSGSHPSQRDPLPPTARREFQGHGVFTLVDRKGDWRYGLEVTQGQRRFLEFPEGSYLEPYVMVSAAAQSSWGLLIAAEYRTRQNLFAEIHHSRAETAPLQSGTVFAGYTWRRLKLGATLKLYDIGSRGADFTREIHDLDGEALTPYYPRGSWLGANLDAAWIDEHFYAKWNQKVLSFLPSLTAWSNPQQFEGTPTGRIDWTSQATAITYGHQQFGVAGSYRAGRLVLSYDAYLFSTFSNRLFMADVGLRGELKIEAGYGITPFAVISRRPVPITSNLARFTTDGLLAGRVYANDTLVDTYGDSLAITGGLLPTKVHTLALGFRWQFNDNWYLVGQGMAKTYDDGYWVSGGETERVGDRYFNTAGEKTYRLVNAPWTQTPFFLGAQGQLVGSDKDRFLFSLGLQAMVSFGATAFGMGAATNEIGVIDTTMANPNGRLFPQGNLDGDRAYIFKLSSGYRFVSTLWGFFTARFRDGQPFAFLTWAQQNGQYQAAYTSNKGSLYQLTGPRTDALIIFDLMLSYTVPLPGAQLKLEAMLANVWDPQMELSERQPGADLGTRAALELQPPRMAMLLAELLF